MEILPQYPKASTKWKFFKVYPKEIQNFTLLNQPEQNRNLCVRVLVRCTINSENKSCLFRPIKIKVLKLIKRKHHSNVPAWEKINVVKIRSFLIPQKQFIVKMKIVHTISYLILSVLCSLFICCSLFIYF